MPERREVGGMPPGAARGVERDADGKRVEDLAHDRLLDLEELVRLVVVPGRPTVIAFACRDRARLRPRAERVRRLEQLTHLAEPRKCELAVLLAGERAQKRDALQPQEVRQRMLVDGAIFTRPSHAVRG